MPHRLRDLVAERAGYRCEYCLAPEAIGNSPHDVEHIQPQHLGGADDESNLALACRSCNGSKHTSTAAPDPLTGLVVRLFNPRTDRWIDDFTVELQSGEIAGRTEVGRATVARLRMNGPRQRQARRLWIYLFGFPADPPSLGPDAEG
jgi:HNH endonuclease